VRIPRGQTSASARVRARVRNADAIGSVPIRVTASGCGPVVAISVDFGRRSNGAPDTALVRAGKKATAVVSVTVSSALAATPDRKHPATCQLTLTATADVPGNVDPSPADNDAVVELVVLDKNDF
jgi:hypothetical protein